MTLSKWALMHVQKLTTFSSLLSGYLFLGEMPYSMRLKMTFSLPLTNQKYSIMCRGENKVQNWEK